MRRGYLLLALAPLLALGGSPAELVVRVQEGPALPYGFYNAAAATDGEWIYVVGGQDNDDYEADLESAFRIHPESGEVQELPDLPYGVDAAGLACLDGFLYVAGGGTRGAIIANAARLDLTAEDPTWESIEHMYVPRRGHQLVVLDGALVAIGGNYYPGRRPLPIPQVCDLHEPDKGDNETFLDMCTPAYSESYDPVADEWAEFPEAELLIPRNTLGVAVADGYLVALGGTALGRDADAELGPAELGEVLSPGASGMAFTSEAPLPMSSGQATSLGGVAWFYSFPGGELPARLLGYVPAEDRWAAADLDITIHTTSFVGVGDRLWIVGGLDQATDQQVTRLWSLQAELQPAVGGGCGGHLDAERGWSGAP
ncbi:MAG: hypothetical protein ABIO70_13905 [Pseudomonadota bacterium]